MGVIVFLDVFVSATVIVVIVVSPTVINERGAHRLRFDILITDTWRVKRCIIAIIIIIIIIIIVTVLKCV